MDVNIIKNALKSEDICESMQEIGFDLILYDEYFPSDFWFIHKGDNIIVYHEKDSDSFECWNKTRTVRFSEGKA